MYFEILHNFSERHGSKFYSLEVLANVYVTEGKAGKAEVESWEVEGVRMPLSAMPDDFYDFMVSMAIHEWEEERGEEWHDSKTDC